MRAALVPLAILSTLAVACGSPAPAGMHHVKVTLSPEPVEQMLLTGQPQTTGMVSGRIVLKPGAAMHRRSTEGHEELLDHPPRARPSPAQPGAHPRPRARGALRPPADGARGAQRRHGGAPLHPYRRACAALSGARARAQLPVVPTPADGPSLARTFFARPTQLPRPSCRCTSMAFRDPLRAAAGRHTVPLDWAGHRLLQLLPGGRVAAEGLVMSKGALSLGFAMGTPAVAKPELHGQLALPAASGRVSHGAR